MTKRTMLHKQTIGVLAGALLITVAGCSQPLSTREKGALIGGGGGALAGGLIGGGKGAAIGGAIGALGGGLTGDQLQKQENIQADQQQQIDQQQRELQRQRREMERMKQQQEY